MGALIAGAAVKGAAGAAVKGAAGAAVKGAAGAAAKGAAGTAIQGVGAKVLSGAAGKGALASAAGGLGAAAKGDKKGLLSQGAAAAGNESLAGIVDQAGAQGSTGIGGILKEFGTAGTSPIPQALQEAVEGPLGGVEVPGAGETPLMEGREGSVGPIRVPGNAQVGVVKFADKIASGVNKVSDFAQNAQEFIQPGNLFRAAGKQFGGAFGDTLTGLGEAFDPFTGEIDGDALMDKGRQKTMKNRRVMLDMIGEDDEALQQILEAVRGRLGQNG